MRLFANPWFWIFSKVWAFNFNLFIATPVLRHYWLMSRYGSQVIGQILSTCNPVNHLRQISHCEIGNTGSQYIWPEAYLILKNHHVINCVGTTVLVNFHLRNIFLNKRATALFLARSVKVAITADDVLFLKALTGCHVDGDDSDRKSVV